MTSKSRNPLRTYSLVVVCLAALAGAGCGSVEPSPTGPSPAPGPAPNPSPSPSPSPSPAPAPSGPGRLEVTIDPNPTPWSGNPIAGSGCDGVTNTWFYTQTLRNSGGNRIAVNERINFFNGREVSRSGLSITLEPGASTSLPTTRWCSASAGPHTAQTNFVAVDGVTNAAINTNGPTVTLQAR